ncbi:hypothetical protein G6F62_015251 [Rhizopus arrhizus]|nr:hypothetical protein G6F62_015251 [Rhizopus arrhizus]
MAVHRHLRRHAGRGAAVRLALGTRAARHPADLGLQPLRPDHGGLRRPASPAARQHLGGARVLRLAVRIQSVRGLHRLEPDGRPRAAYAARCWAPCWRAAWGRPDCSSGRRYC